MFIPQRRVIHPRDFFEQELPDGEELEAFALWAFGDGYQTVYSGKLPDMWNKLHGETLILHESNLVEDDAPKMVALWKARDM